MEASLLTAEECGPKWLMGRRWGQQMHVDGYSHPYGYGHVTCPWSKRRMSVTKTREMDSNFWHSRQRDRDCSMSDTICNSVLYCSMSDAICSSVLYCSMSDTICNGVLYCTRRAAIGRLSCPDGARRALAAKRGGGVITVLTVPPRLLPPRPVVPAVPGCSLRTQPVPLSLSLSLWPSLWPS